jgi:phospholipase C
LTFLALLAAGISACGGGSFNAPSTFMPAGRAASGSSPIKHVVIVIQENRSFDNFFATFPGADGTKVGRAAAIPSSYGCPFSIRTETTIPLTEVDLQGKASGNWTKWYARLFNNDLGHIYTNFQTAYDHQKMDGFDLESTGARGSGTPTCTYPYQYVNPADIKPYWDMAKQYVLADHTFQTQASGSFTAHQDLIAAGTGLSSEEALIDTPSYFPWGCDARTPDPNKKVTGVVTAVIKRGGKVEEYGGPFPCLKYTTMRDLLDAKSVTWKFYALKVYPWTQCPKCQGAGIWSAFDAIKAVRYSSEWDKNVSHTPNEIFSDIKKNKLPDVAWVTPTGDNSDHPQTGKDTGPSWVGSIVNAIGKSSYWDSTAVIVVWDDWGGFYDHVQPPTPRDWQGGPGFRVPMLIISPYVKPHVEHLVYQFGSVLHFIEDNWGLGTLGRNDAHSNSIRGAFDFNMKPRPFKVIQTKYSQSFFLHQPYSGQPLDTE